MAAPAAAPAVNDGDDEDDGYMDGGDDVPITYNWKTKSSYTTHYTLDGVGSRVFDSAIHEMSHPGFVDFGRGSKAPAVAVVETPSAAAYHPTGQSPSGGLDYGQHTAVVGALSAVAHHPTGQSPSGSLDYGGELHVDSAFHCVDGGVCNLLLSHYPDIAKKLKAHLIDDEFKRMNFKELVPWFHLEGVHLQAPGRHARAPALSADEQDRRARHRRHQGQHALPRGGHGTRRDVGRRDGACRCYHGG